MKRYILIIFSFLFCCFFLGSIEFFEGYHSSLSSSGYSVESLLGLKYTKKSKWYENYFHEAQFPAEGMTIFTNVIFSNTATESKGCKVNVIITFADRQKYTLNVDYDTERIIVAESGFSIKFDNENYIKLNGNNYLCRIKNRDISLELDYKIVNPPFVFGNGKVLIDSKKLLVYSQPVAGAEVSAKLIYRGQEFLLNGRGSVDHDFNLIPPKNNPTQWRSFWLYNENYTVIMHTFIYRKKTQIDRILVYKNGRLYKHFINTGMEYGSRYFDEKTGFTYPKKYLVNYTDGEGDNINMSVSYNSTTDIICVFDNLSPALHRIVAAFVGEMWAYRFWADAEISLTIDGKSESFTINGLGNYIDTTKN